MAEEKKPMIKLTREQLINAFGAERANLDALQQQMVAMDNALREILGATDALNAIKKSKEGEKIVVPVGAGIYIDAAIESSSKAKSSLAGGVVVNTSIEDALKELEAKKQETENAIAGVRKDQERTITTLNSLGNLLQSLEQKRSQQQARTD